MARDRYEGVTFRTRAGRAGAWWWRCALAVTMVAHPTSATSVRLKKIKAEQRISRIHAGSEDHAELRRDSDAMRKQCNSSGCCILILLHIVCS